jgi:hypothetical protein
MIALDGGGSKRNKTGLKYRMKVFKKWHAQKLEKLHWYALWAWGFMDAAFGEGKCNFFKCD